ncbi:MAG: aminoacyl-tRNA hydrolase, partial [Actinomycetota bacterium]|nr:aminoacyl-tRNA hydrolase [Actinomycetota bacterium]
VRLRKSKASALCAEAKSGNRNVVIAVPETYMNESGLAARKLMDRYNISEPAQLIVIHDELDLPVGKIKIKVGGGLAGHNGLRSIESHVHSREFARIRIGVGAIHEGQRGRDYVLSRPGKVDRQALEHSKSKAVEALDFIQTYGHQAAMNKFNA